MREHYSAVAAAAAAAPAAAPAPASYNRVAEQTYLIQVRTSPVYSPYLYLYSINASADEHD